jgi:(S)-ureidoglycine---glyoxylate transaminase
MTGQVNPPPRLLMGPGPVTADPRVLRAMSAQLVGQFDPWMTAAMTETMGLYRQVFRTANEQTFLVDGTSRAGIEAALVSLLEPGDRVLVPIFGRFGHLLTEIASRCGAEVHTIEVEWGEVFAPEVVEDAVRRVRPKVLAAVQGDTSTTMCQPLADLGEICRRHDVLLYCDATASLGGNEFAMDDWSVDLATAGLQKCLGGPSGSAPVSVSDRAVAVIDARKHIEAGLRDPGGSDDDEDHGARIASNYLDLAQVMDYWGPRRLNHHTEATTMLYGARECARLLVEEGVDQAVARHALHGRAMFEGVRGLGLAVFGDVAHKMHNVVAVEIPDGVDGDRARAALLDEFGIEIGTSFGPLHGRVWRIGTMGYNARKDAVLLTLAALEQVLRGYGAPVTAGGGVGAAREVYA